MAKFICMGIIALMTILVAAPAYATAEVIQNAGSYYLQDVIEPGETRNYIINVLNIIRDSKDKGIGKHHLSNWPTKF